MPAGRINREAEQVASLPLPQAQPSPEARRGRPGPGSYDAGVWNFEYQVTRFLERATPESLDSRYQSILRNLRTLIREDRDLIPIDSFMSSWYWFRKEYQTRVEYAFRGKVLPPPIVPLYQPKKVPIEATPPKVGAWLFRYGQGKYLQSTRAGNVWLANCDNYAHMQGDLARGDIEYEKSSYLPGAHTRITTLDGREIPVLGDVTQSVRVPRYYLLSMASEWDADLFDEFSESDACLVIRDPEAFRSRLMAGCSSALPGSRCELLRVEYFDPYERPHRQIFESTICKDFRFAYQQEWRFVCFRPNGEEAREKHFTFTAPGLEDISDVIGRAT